MQRIERFLELLYERKILQEYDRIIPVVGDESKGKSTFMLQCTWLWQQIRGEDPGVESVLERVVWDDRAEFKRALSEYDRRAAVPVMDAARVLHKKEAINPDQIEVEKDLLDVRVKEHLILLGFQDWDVIPTPLQKRRAKNLFYIPTRGRVWGYNRDAIDERLESGDEWPDPNMKTRFPSLEGTELWSRFKEQDREHKKERIKPDESEGEEESLEPRDVVAELKDTGLDGYIEENPYNGHIHLSADLIQFDYDLTVRGAKQVKKALERDLDIEAIYHNMESGAGGEGGAHT